MKKNIVAFLILVCARALAESGSEPAPRYYNQLLLGGGSSIKGFGKTGQEVRTADVIWRHARILQENKTGWLRGNRELWMELPFSFIVSDSDHQDSNDIGLTGANFLFAWVFPPTGTVQPYVMTGGGPVLVLADIDGVGSDLCGNYQAGCGLRFNKMKHPVNMEIRYHHISNLGMADPNVPLNSVKLFIGVTF